MNTFKYVIITLYKKVRALNYYLSQKFKFIRKGQYFNVLTHM